MAVVAAALSRMVTLMMRFCAPPMMVSPPRSSTGIGPMRASTVGTDWTAAS
jgi:hypothetical protein